MPDFAFETGDLFIDTKEANDRLSNSLTTLQRQFLPARRYRRSALFSENTRYRLALFLFGRDFHRPFRRRNKVSAIQDVPFSAVQPIWRVLPNLAPSSC